MSAFTLTTPLVPLDGGSGNLPPIDRRPFKPGPDGNRAGDGGLPDGVRATPISDQQMQSMMRDAFPRPPAAPQPPRDPAIDDMIAQWLQEGWLYLHAPSGEYRTRDRRWRELTEEEKTWNS